MLIKRTLWIGTLVAVFALALIGIGRQAGEDVAKADIELLSLVWPYVMDMQQNERALLAGLSITCRLSLTATDRESVIACLRSAAAGPAQARPARRPCQPAARIQSATDWGAGIRPDETSFPLITSPGVFSTP